MASSCSTARASRAAIGPCPALSPARLSIASQTAASARLPPRPCKSGSPAANPAPLLGEGLLPRSLHRPSSRVGAAGARTESAQRPGASHGTADGTGSVIGGCRVVKLPRALASRAALLLPPPAQRRRRSRPRPGLHTSRRPPQAAMAARLTALWSKARAAAEPAVKVASKEVATRYEQMMANNAQVGRHSGCCLTTGQQAASAFASWTCCLCSCSFCCGVCSSQSRGMLPRALRLPSRHAFAVRRCASGHLHPCAASLLSSTLS